MKKGKIVEVFTNLSGEKSFQTWYFLIIKIASLTAKISNHSQHFPFEHMNIFFSILENAVIINSILPRSFSHRWRQQAKKILKNLTPVVPKHTRMHSLQQNVQMPRDFVVLGSVTPLDDGLRAPINKFGSNCIFF